MKTAINLLLIGFLVSTSVSVICFCQELSDAYIFDEAGEKNVQLEPDGLFVPTFPKNVWHYATANPGEKFVQFPSQEFREAAQNEVKFIWAVGKNYQGKWEKLWIPFSNETVWINKPFFHYELYLAFVNQQWQDVAFAKVVLDPNLIANKVYSLSELFLSAVPARNNRVYFAFPITLPNSFRSQKFDMTLELNIESIQSYIQLPATYNRAGYVVSDETLSLWPSPYDNDIPEIQIHGVVSLRDNPDEHTYEIPPVVVNPIKCLGGMIILAESAEQPIKVHVNFYPGIKSIPVAVDKNIVMTSAVISGVLHCPDEIVSIVLGIHSQETQRIKVVIEEHWPHKFYCVTNPQEIYAGASTLSVFLYEVTISGGIKIAPSSVGLHIHEFIPTWNKPTKNF